MTDSRNGSETLEVVMKRADVLRQLCRSPAYKRDLIDATGHSRSTVDRAIRELTDLNLVERGEDGLTATPAAHLAVNHLDAFQAGLDDIVDADSVIEPLPLDAPLTRQVVVGSDARLATDPVPYQSLEPSHTALTDAKRYRALLPTLDDPRHIRLLYEHVITDGNPAELVVTPELFDTLAEEFPRKMAAMADVTGFRLHVSDDLPPFALGLVDRDGEPLVSVVVFTERGAVHGTLGNDSSEATRWGEHLFEERRDDAVDRTVELRGDGSASGQPAGGPSVGQSLPVQLASEGFVRLDVTYFREEPVAAPTTAWRAGLSLAEVHTGYAVERRPNNDHSGEETSAARTGAGMADQLRNELTTGESCLIVGPPGSGKSTVCKRVACRWYDDDLGTVLYREQGRGRSFEAVDELVEAATDADGHTLVVVEDAVRQEANAVFEALTELSDRSDVSFLLDARESEWVNPPVERGATENLHVVPMPALDEADCQRLVEQFERTLGEPVDVPVEQLYDEIRAETLGADDAAPSELLLLLHRLATYADPLAEEQTSLEEAVAAVYDDLAGDDLTLSVSILVNALNAAGLEVAPELVYAVGEPDEWSAVEATLDRLDGRVLFTQEHGYRTVHESWSVAFLEHLLVTEGQPSAAERFGETVTALLSLADRADERDRIAREVSGHQTLYSLRDDPAEWVRRTIEEIYALGMERPKLAPLFGDGEYDSIELPTATPASVIEHRPVWLGRAFLNGGYYERAERAFRRLAAEDGRLAAERLLGLARVYRERGEYDDAAAHAEACLDLSEGMDWLVERASANLLLGQVASQRGKYETASTHHEAALDGFEAAGNQRGVATALKAIGKNARRQGEYDRAREQHERALVIQRELGDRQGAAQSLNNLGIAARRQGEPDAAREYFEQALDVQRELGDRQGEADTLNNIGIVDVIQGNYERASEYLQRSLVITRALGDRQGESSTLSNIALIVGRLGEYDQAREYHERNLELKDELGDRQGRASVLSNLALVALHQGAYEQAREYLERSRGISRELGSRQQEANSIGNLGHVFRERGEYDRARECHERSLEIKEELGDRQGRANSLTNLGILARLEGEHDRARARFEEAAATFEDAGDPFRVGERQLERGRLSLECGESGLARERAQSARQMFAEMGATHKEARCRLLLGRIAAATGDSEAAREHWQAALETFAAVGAPQDVLTALKYLSEAARQRGDEEALQRWRARVEECVADAPPAVVEQHREWLGEPLDRNAG